jgi:hypothetical protein
MFDKLSLRTILLVDGLVSGAMGLLLIAGAGLLDGALDLPDTFLRSVGIVLLPWCALLVLIATRQAINLAAVRFVIAVNLGWVAASLLLPFTGWVEPNAFGVAFIIVQALAVIAFALAQIAKQVEAVPAAHANRIYQV